MKEEVINDNVTRSGKIDLEVQNDFKTLSIVSWMPRWIRQLAVTNFFGLIFK